MGEKSQTDLAVLFSPLQNSILAYAYVFTSPLVIKALLGAALSPPESYTVK